MAEAPSALWSARQRQLLQAMGHPLWRVARTAGDRVVASESAAPAGHRMTLRQAGSGAAVALLLSDPAPPAGSPEQRLLLSLLRSAGLGDAVDPGPRDAQAVGQPDVATLALPPLRDLLTQPGAKRALWPALRSLRRDAGIGRQQ